ncbi:hypothetical protein MRB53_040331 [Persea americana]|nr:hypothetical protein MRB53_040331 [Persea americana]
MTGPGPSGTVPLGDGTGILEESVTVELALELEFDPGAWYVVPLGKIAPSVEQAAPGVPSGKFSVTQGANSQTPPQKPASYAGAHRVCGRYSPALFASMTGPPKCIEDSRSLLLSSSVASVRLIHSAR